MLDSFNNKVYKIVVLPTPLGPTIMQLISCLLANMLPMATTKGGESGGRKEVGQRGEGAAVVGQGFPRLFYVRRAKNGLFGKIKSLERYSMGKNVGGCEW